MTDAARPHPQRMDRRQFAIGGALLATAAAGLALRPRRSFPPPAPGALDRAVPKTIGRWRYVTASGIITAPEDELSVRLYDQVLTRVYAGPGDAAISLLIAYGSAQNSALQLHRPENCYPAQGWSLGPRHFVTLAFGGERVNACQITAERTDMAEQLLYWARIDHRFTVDNADDRAAIVHANLRGYLPDGVLVRMSMRDRGVAAATAAMRDFNDAMLAGLGGAGRRLLLGQA